MINLREELVFINLTRNLYYMEKLTVCSSALSKMIGLMFQKKKTIVLDLTLEQEVYLHMFFVFYPIDMVFLDKNKKVIGIKSNVKPFTPLIKSPKCYYILESPEIGKYKLGAKLQF